MAFMTACLMLLLQATWCSALVHPDSYQYEPPNFPYESYVPVAPPKAEPGPAPEPEPEAEPEPELETEAPVTTTTTPATTTTKAPLPTTSPTTIAAPITVTAAEVIETTLRPAAGGNEVNFKLSTLSAPDQGPKLQGYEPPSGYDGDEESAPPDVEYGDQKEVPLKPLPPQPPQRTDAPHAPPDSHMPIDVAGPASATVDEQRGTTILTEPSTPPPTPAAPDEQYQMGTAPNTYDTEPQESTHGKPVPPTPAGAPSPPGHGGASYEHSAELPGSPSPPAPPAPEGGDIGIEPVPEPAPGPEPAPEPQHPLPDPTPAEPDHQPSGEEPTAGPPEPPPPQPSPKPGYVFPSMINYGSLNSPEAPNFVLEPRQKGNKRKPQKVLVTDAYGFPPSPRTSAPVPAVTEEPPAETEPEATLAPETEPPPPPAVTTTTPPAPTTTQATTTTTLATTAAAAKAIVTKKPCKNSGQRTNPKAPCTKQQTSAPVHVRATPPVPPPVTTPCPRSRSKPNTSPVKPVKPPCKKSAYNQVRVIDDVMLVPEKKPMTAGCEDGFEKCPEWAQNGECETNPFWMKPNCQKSCNSCGVGLADVEKPLTKSANCVNNHELCQFWKKVGECERNEPYMTRHCPLSCGVC